jgi:photosystem II stability/assembly factor-like uncharacterized protein
VFVLVTVPIAAAEPTPGKEEEEKHPLAGIKLRSIGPAISSGRVTDFAVHPQRKNEYFVATASGNLWKTTNAGITWSAVMDDQGSYAIGCVATNPANPLEVWVGTGENNSQRSVGYGDGVYKSIDGGKSWKNMGLPDSEHISQIRFDPRDPKVVFVASQGPLWNAGGDRGLYRTGDGGENWERILEIDEHTGVNELVIDPRNPDVMVASSYQRRRHVWVLLNGGPGSGIHKTTDGGKSWREIDAGLPKDDMGRIGLALAPSAPDTIYAIIEGMEDEKGVYRSTDFGENWTKQSKHLSTSPQYYNELVVDPHDPDRLYSLSTFSWISEDAGKTFQRLSVEHRHVDDHALWIDPDDTKHLLIGGDGGIYESWDRGQTWRHVRNLPITQFYRGTPDNDFPFYNVYGGTQDNNTLGAPSRTTTVHGITNADWLFVLGGDGYKPQIDPTDADTIYAQYQYGGLARYDRRSRERVYIAPQAASGEDSLRWNWNSPLLISPHDPKRLYYGCQSLYRSDDRGNSWHAISGDLSRNVDRNELEVMGRVWSVDAIAKNDSTSRYGSLIALDESPLEAGLIYTGSDDGLIHVTEDGGESWREIDGVKGVPEWALVEDIIASRHDANVAYAVFDNHKKGDFKPYVFRTGDRGRGWKSITGDLPERGTAHTIIQDHSDPKLLFVGTEFGLFFTQDGGGSWHPLRGGFPTIAVRDLEIQRRENDLVVVTFGRGFYILDDYTPLRTPAAEVEATEATLFGVKDAWLYVPSDPFGGGKKGSMGAEFYGADNPPFGAVFTYYLEDGLKKKSKLRREAEQEIEKEGGDTPYPDWDELREEDREEDPAIVLTITDTTGKVVRRISGPVEAGLHRVAWDLRLPAPDPISLEEPEFRAPWDEPPFGPLAIPGDYRVKLAKRAGGELIELAGPERFTVKALDQGAETAPDRRALQQFQIKTARLRRAVEGAFKATGEIDSRIKHLKKALIETTDATEDQHRALRAIESRLADLRVSLTGDRTITSRNESAPWSIRNRASSVVWGHWQAQAPVTETHREAYRIAANEFTVVLAGLKAVTADLTRFEQQAERVFAPWTPGRLPDWKPE